MKTRELSRAVSVAALLLPCLSAADSQIAMESAAAAPAARHASAAAHLSFKVVIPPMLALEITDAVSLDGSLRVRISSNGRAVALASSHGQSSAGRDAVVTAAAGRMAVPQTTCLDQMPQDSRAATCTVSTP